MVAGTSMLHAIKAQILRRFAGDHLDLIAWRARLTAVCEAFVTSGRADPNFVSKFTSGRDHDFWACLSEALIADRLSHMQFLPRPRVGAGPDFLIACGNRRVWIEVVCPEPKNISDIWLDPPPVHRVNFPHVDILLRWTHAIKAKADRLIGDSEGRSYLKEGVVSPDDAYVIAVNGCRLRSGPFPELIGISQFPFAAEAVFSIGPYQIEIDRETLKAVAADYQHRPIVRNRNNSPVAAYMFLDPTFANISAIWAVDLNGSSVRGGSEPMFVVHNPNATNAIPVGFLPSDADYVCSTVDGELVLERRPHA